MFSSSCCGRARTASQPAILVQLRARPSPDPAASPSQSVVAVVVPRHLRHVQVHVVDRQPGAFAGARLERLREPADVVGRQRHAEDASTTPGMRRSALNVSICRRKPPLIAADLVVRLLVAVEADRDDRCAPGPGRRSARRCARCGRSGSRWSESAGAPAAASRSTTASKISSMSGGGRSRRRSGPPR